MGCSRGKSGGGGGGGSNIKIFSNLHDLHKSSCRPQGGAGVRTPWPSTPLPATEASEHLLRYQSFRSRMANKLPQ